MAKVTVLSSNSVLPHPPHYCLNFINKCPGKLFSMLFHKYLHSILNFTLAFGLRGLKTYYQAPWRESSRANSAPS